MITGDELNVSAWPYSQQDLQEAKHQNNLPKRDFITVNMDLQQIGLGGDDTWSPRARAHEEHLLPARQYRYRFVIGW